MEFKWAKMVKSMNIKFAAGINAFKIRILDVIIKLIIVISIRVGNWEIIIIH